MTGGTWGVHCTVVVTVHLRPPEPINALAASSVPWSCDSQPPTTPQRRLWSWRCRGGPWHWVVRAGRPESLIINTRLAPHSSPGGHMDCGGGRARPRDGESFHTTTSTTIITSTHRTSSWTDRQTQEQVFLQQLLSETLRLCSIVIKKFNLRISKYKKILSD